jgi:hypothetical protein
MASVTVASQSFMQPMHQCPKVRSGRAASSQGSRSIKSKRSYSLFSIDRSLQSQFSSQALHSSRGRSVATAGRSSRAELAPDANIGNVITVEDCKFAHVLEIYLKIEILQNYRCCSQLVYLASLSRASRILILTIDGFHYIYLMSAINWWTGSFFFVIYQSFV